jgi:hypothetical protein
VGFAATLGHGTVLRGGFGTSYWPNNVASPANLKSAPFTSSYTINQTPNTPALRLSGSVPVATPDPTCLIASCGATLPVGGFSITSGTKLDYRYTLAYMFNLIIEKEIGNNVIGIGFVGEPVRHLGRVVPNANTNLPPLGPGGCGVTTQVSFPSPCQPYYAQLPLVNSLQLLQTDAVSNYNAMQVTFQRRYSAGLTIASNYTFASALSDVGGTGGACTGCAQVLNNFGRDYGPSDSMVKHRMTFTADYELPFAKSANGLMGQVAKGWQVNAIYAYAIDESAPIRSPYSRWRITQTILLELYMKRMSHLFIVLVGTTLIFPAVTLKSQTPRTSMKDPTVYIQASMTGEQFLSLKPAALQQWYVSGLVDGFNMWAQEDHGPSWMNECGVTKMTTAQITAIISKYLGDHPEYWNQPINALSFNAIAKACKVSR